MEKTKVCTKCGRELPLECFSKDKRSKDELCCWCKECRKEYYQTHREEKLEYQKQYDAEHTEERAAYFKQYKKQRYATIEGYARNIRNNNLRDDRKYGRCSKDKDILPSLEYYIWALQQRDFYDGKQYHWSEMGLDRIYNDKAHTFANVVPCSTAHNRQRGRKTFEEFCEVMKNEELEIALS